MKCIWKCNQCDAAGTSSETREAHLEAHLDHVATISRWIPDPPPRPLLAGVDIVSGRDLPA